MDGPEHTQNRRKISFVQWQILCSFIDFLYVVMYLDPHILSSEAC